MSKIITTNLKHFNRMEEQEILEYVAEHNNIGHVSVFGTSGTGKTELISSSISLLHNGDFFSGYTVLHYDASQIPEDCTMDVFYNLLIINYCKKPILMGKIKRMSRKVIHSWHFWKNRRIRKM